MSGRALVAAVPALAGLVLVGVDLVLEIEVRVSALGPTRLLVESVADVVDTGRRTLLF
jgi:hypothetical protein